MPKLLEKLVFTLGKITQAGHVYRDDPDAASRVPRAEEPARHVSPQFRQLETEMATHRANVTRPQIAVDEVLEVGQPVLRGHLEQCRRNTVVPLEVLGQIVCGNWKGERSPVHVTFHHDFHERTIYHLHFFRVFLVSFLAQLAANYHVLAREVLRDCQVKRDVRERRLPAPARGDVEVEHESLHRLLYLSVVEPILANERCEQCIDGIEGLCSGPLVLQAAYEVRHLEQSGVEMRRRPRRNLARDAVESLRQELAQGPSRTVARYPHAQVVNVEISVNVRIRNLHGVDSIERVVRNHRASDVKQQARKGVTHIAVLLDPPILHAQIIINNVFNFEKRRF